MTNEQLRIALTANAVTKQTRNHLDSVTRVEKRWKNTTSPRCCAA